MRLKMKRLVSLVYLILAGNGIFAESHSNLFHQSVDEVALETDLGLIGDYTLLDLDSTIFQSVLANHPHTLTVTIPYGDGELELIVDKKHLFRNDFAMRSASGLVLNYSDESSSVFYQGTFSGYPNSHFALSVLNHEVIGVGHIPGIGDVNLGQIEELGAYIFYSESALNGHNDFQCFTTEEPTGTPELGGGSRELIEDCSGIYFEVDYDIFLAKGSVLEATDYMLALFNEIQLLYEIDGITIYISDIFVWDVVSPYYEISDTGILLNLFGTTTVVWTGDLGHFVNLAAGGGLAWVNVFCSPDQALKKAVSGISLTFEAIPIYSWSVEVIAHEMGHNMGSPHTHACFWNGDMTAIDGCGPDAGFDEGCAGPIPAEGGTVMSYCHLTPVGINLGLGFGVQPSDYMKENILAAACLTSCDLTVMDIDVKGGTISPACENGPIFRQITFDNNSNDDLTSFTIQVYLEGALVESYDWSGFVPEGGSGSFNLPATSLTFGTYTMVLELIVPSGYPDDNMADNYMTFNFDVTAYPVAGFEFNPTDLVSYNAVTNFYNLSTGAAAYTWNFDDGSPVSTLTDPQHTFPFEKGGLYDVMLLATSPEGCVDTAVNTVNVQGGNIFYIPNTFTPDQNSFNDTFTPIFASGLDVYDYHFVIFNRAGEILFESYNVAGGWNGSYGDKGIVKDGVYVWLLEFGDLNSDEIHVETGHVTVLR